MQEGFYVNLISKQIAYEEVEHKIIEIKEHDGSIDELLYYVQVELNMLRRFTGNV